MAEGGVFAIARTVFDHPFFAPEKYTEREAWMWMIGAAAWQPMTIRVGRVVVKLQRGELAFSTRFLAKKWQWSRSHVIRFLIRLKTETMVTPVADHEVTHLIICNYDDYQFSRTSRGPQTGPQTGPVADQSRTKEEELNKGIK